MNLFKKSIPKPFSPFAPQPLAIYMSRIDLLTGKRANTANKRSHSNIATKRRQNVNLQTIRLGGVKIRVSTRTLRTLKRLAKEERGEMPTLKQKRAAKRAARKAKAAS